MDPTYNPKQEIGFFFLNFFAWFLPVLKRFLLSINYISNVYSICDLTNFLPINIYSDFKKDSATRNSDPCMIIFMMFFMCSKTISVLRQLLHNVKVYICTFKSMNYFYQHILIVMSTQLVDLTWNYMIAKKYELFLSSYFSCNIYSARGSYLGAFF